MYDLLYVLVACNWLKSEYALFVRICKIISSTFFCYDFEFFFLFCFIVIGQVSVIKSGYKGGRSSGGMLKSR